MRGMELMIVNVLKMLGIDPVKVQIAVDAVRVSIDNGARDLAALKTQNDQILMNQHAIMSRLGIEAEITSDAQLRIGHN